jgi:hypothetical protein
MNRSLKLSTPLVSLMLLLGACGGGGDGKQASSGTTQPAAATTATTARNVFGGIVSDARLAQQCVNYASFVAGLGLSLAAAMDPNAARQVEDLKGKINFDEAPAELKDDVAVLRAYAEDLGKVLAKYDLKSGQPDPQAIAAMAEFSRTVDTARLQKATDSIDAWLKAHCPR